VAQNLLEFCKVTSESIKMKIRNYSWLALPLICLSFSSHAVAGPISFGWTNTGVLDFGATACPSNVAGPGVVCLNVVGTGSADDNGNSIPGSWAAVTDQLQVRFTANPTANYADGTFTWTDLVAGNGLFGTVRTTPGSVQVVDGVTITTVLSTYTVLGGSGMFLGATGTGSASEDFTPTSLASRVSFVERGTMSLLVPSTSVPEPATFILMLIGIGAVLLVRSRDRHTLRARW
jgi:hypothetical protein